MIVRSTSFVIILSSLLQATTVSAQQANTGSDCQKKLVECFIKNMNTVTSNYKRENSILKRQVPSEDFEKQLESLCKVFDPVLQCVAKTQNLNRAECQILNDSGSTPVFKKQILPANITLLSLQQMCDLSAATRALKGKCILKSMTKKEFESKFDCDAQYPGLSANLSVIDFKKPRLQDPITKQRCEEFRLYTGCKVLSEEKRCPDYKEKAGDIPYQWHRLFMEYTNCDEKKLPREELVNRYRMKVVYDIDDPDTSTIIVIQKPSESELMNASKANNTKSKTFIPALLVIISITLS